MESLARNGAGALLLSSDVFFTDHTDQLVALATSYRVPVMYSSRKAAAAGGLVSYGNDGREIRRQDVTYIARVLDGTKPADLPVQQVTKIELVVNTKTAKAIGLTIPESVVLRADEVIQ